MTVRLDGFKQATRTVTLTVDQIARLDFALELGAVSESVEVSGAAPLLESSTASIGQVVETQMINDMPLNGRNYLDLAKLSIGVAEPSSGDRAASGGAFVANGVRSDMNNFILDGVDNNAKIVDLSSNSNVVIQPSVDAIQEFKVETNNFSAEYGYSAGAIVNATIKSGTNRYHGTAFEFLRNDVFDARHYFLLPSDAKPILQRNQYGGVFGGPVVRNKTFFFASWEGTRTNQGNTFVDTLPNAALRAGNFAGQKTINDPAATVPNPSGSGYIKTPFPNNIIPPDRISKTAAMLTAVLPQANGTGVVNNYVSSPTQRTKRDEFDTRADQNFSDRDKMFLRYSYYVLNFVNPGPLPPPLIGSASFQQSINDQSGHVASFGETHLFGASLVNEFRAGYNRISNALAPFVNYDIDPQFGIGYIPPQPGLTGLPEISITGYSRLGEASFLPDKKGSDTALVSDSLLWTKGSHFIKLGGQYRWVRSRFDIDGSARGVFTFNGVFSGNGFADFLLGDASNATLSNVLFGDLRYKYYGAFINDDWKVTPRLTLNLGLRYEVWTPPYERHDNQANFLIGPNKLIYVHDKIPAGIPAALVMPTPPGLDARGLLENHYNNWAPRMGAAYQLLRNSVIRAGGGLFYAEGDALGASGRPTANPPYRINNTYPTDQIHPVITFAGGFPANSLDPQAPDPTTATFIAFNPAMKIPVVYHWSLSLQQQMGKYLLDANYVGTKGTHLMVNYDYNTDFPGPGSTASRRPVQGFATITYADAMGNSEYEALQMRVQRRYSNGISLLVSYTYSKSIDLGSGGLIADLAIRDVTNIGLERATSSSSIPHRVSVSYTYALPLGRGRRFLLANPLLNGMFGNWQANGIATLRAGHPFTPEWSSSAANTGDPRPDRIGNGALPADQRSVNRWFDTKAFVYPTPYNFGNSGRDVVYGPGAVNFDFSVFKRYRVKKLGDVGEAQLRFEAFNLFNHPQFGQPNANVTIPQGGTITTLSTSMRQIQFGIKVVF
jgi:hypothetical protein